MFMRVGLLLDAFVDRGLTAPLFTITGADLRAAT
jgi:hypothetical protein